MYSSYVLDQFAFESYRRAWSAIETGVFKPEIVPVEIPIPRREAVVFDVDEIPLKEPKTSREALARLRPVFKKEGSVTAGNASKISDGQRLWVAARSSASVLKERPVWI